MTDPALHWYIVSIEQTLTPTGYLIVVTTSQPVNLNLRWTSTVPQKHFLPIIRRGATVGTIIDQCFVAYTDVPQEEPGDTLTHTFNIDPWPHCQWRWFYFHGTVTGRDSPSLSPIYEKHRSDPIGPILLGEAPWDGGIRTPQGFCNAWHTLFTPTRSCIVTGLTIWCQEHPTYPDVNTARIGLWSCRPDYMPETSLHQDAQDIVIGLPGKPWQELNFPIPSITLTAGALYSLQWAACSSCTRSTRQLYFQSSARHLMTWPPAIPPTHTIQASSPVSATLVGGVWVCNPVVPPDTWQITDTLIAHQFHGTLL